MKLYLSLGIALVLALVVGIGVIISRSISTADAHEQRIVIPLGTGELITKGQDPAVIPAEIHLTVGDTLVIENQDVVGHEVSDLWVGAGETLRQKFSTAGTYIGACTVHKDSQIKIIVSET